jgi:hypothetical protein
MRASLTVQTSCFVLRQVAATHWLKTLSFTVENVLGFIEVFHRKASEKLETFPNIF